MKRKKNPGPLVKQAVEPDVVSWGPSAPTLRSDLDEPMRLPRPFLDLVSRFGEAKVRYDRGHFSKEQYAQVLAGLVVVWADGTEWTLGATSGVWYRRFHGLPWVAAVPPEGSEEEFDAWQRETGGEDPWAAAVDPASVMDPVAEVQDVGRPVAAEDPWPVVSDEPSGLELPSFTNETVVIDEHGVWSSTFSLLDELSEPAGATTPEDLTGPGLETVPGGTDGAGVGLPGLADLVKDDPDGGVPGVFELPAELFGDDPE